MTVEKTIAMKSLAKKTKKKPISSKPPLQKPIMKKRSASEAWNVEGKQPKHTALIKGGAYFERQGKTLRVSSLLTILPHLWGKA